MSGGAGAALFFGFVIVVTIGWILLSRAFDTGINVLFRNTLFRGVHKTGDYLIKNPLVFKAQANFDTLKKRIFNEIVPPNQGPSRLPSLYLSKAGMNPKGEYVATFRKGSTTKCSLEVDVKLRHDAAGVVGSVDVVRWRLINSVIQNVNEMQMLRRRVEEIVLSLDPNAQLSHRSTPIGPSEQQQFAPQNQNGFAPQQPAGPPAPHNGYATFNAPSGYAPPPPPGGSTPNPAPPPQSASPAPLYGSRYAVPDTRSWVDRNQR